MSSLAALKRPFVAAIALVTISLAVAAKPIVSSSWSQWFPGSWTWSVAKSHAADLDEGGYTDWRLPTRAEVKAAITSGALPQAPEPNTTRLIWTSETKGNKAWCITYVTDANGNVIPTEGGDEELRLKTSILDAIAIRP